MQKIDCFRAENLHINAKFCSVTFLVLSGFLLSPDFTENSLTKKISTIIPTISYAQSSEALWMLRDCDERADSRHEDRVRKAQVKRNAENDLINKQELFSNITLDILTISARMDDDPAEEVLDYYFNYRRREADKTYDDEVISAEITLNKDKFECEVAARKLDEELRYVDEAERNIHFNFGLGSVQYNFLDISPFPKTKVTVQHVR